MAKNDVVVRNAADLEKKYNFASLFGLKKNVEQTAEGMQKIQNELNSMLNALIINLKDVLDSQSDISLWFYSGIPTTSNEPYTLWANPSEHIGDIYYDQSSGYVYQYKEVNGTRLWEINTHPDLVEAMAITNAELDTSEDHERKVFFTTPTIPYSNGDWWIKEDGSLFICQISKISGTYESNDFINSSNYTESIAEKVGEEIKVLKGTITMLSESYAKFTDLETGGSTVISGDNITSGSISSQNYVKDTSGTKISLDDGTIDTKNFKVDAEGTVTVTGGEISLTSEDDEDPKFRVYNQENTDYAYMTNKALQIENKNQNFVAKLTKTENEDVTTDLSYFQLYEDYSVIDADGAATPSTNHIQGTIKHVSDGSEADSVSLMLSSDVGTNIADIEMTAASGDVNITLSDIDLEEGTANELVIKPDRIEMDGTTVVEKDTGWIDARLEFEFKPYNDIEGNTPKYRRKNGIVEIRGVVSPLIPQDAGWGATIFTIPEGFRPALDINKLCQGSGSKKWLLGVSKDGAVTFARYGDTSNAAIPETAWLPFQITYFID